jgi:hypothetical protein
MVVFSSETFPAWFLLLGLFKRKHNIFHTTSINFRKI